MNPLERWLPEPDVRTRFGRAVRARPEPALATLLGLGLAELPLTRTLLRLRGFRAGRTATFGALVSAAPFTVLQRDERALVAGLIGQPWRASGGVRTFEPPEFADFDEPGYAKMASAAWAEERASGALLVIETRVVTLGPRAGVLFRRYWRIIGPFSNAIRREALRRAARRVVSDATAAADTSETPASRRDEKG